MNIDFLKDKLKESNSLDNPVKKHTLIINDKSETQGALFFIPVTGKEYKVLLPAPFHEELFINDDIPSYKAVLSHKQAVLLK